MAGDLISLDEIDGIGRSADLSSLVIKTKAGGLFEIGAEKLRLSCKCAHCLRARIEEKFPAAFPGIAIVDIQNLGYGLNVSFSDGHARGIYPLPYLISLL